MPLVVSPLMPLPPHATQRSSLLQRESLLLQLDAYLALLALSLFPPLAGAESEPDLSGNRLRGRSPGSRSGPAG